MLKPFRRHSAVCLYGPGGKPGAPVKPGLLANPKLTAEKIRKYPHCTCACWYAGTTIEGHNVPRTSLHTDDWKIAERLVMEKGLTDTQRAAKLSLSEALERWYRSTTLALRADATLLNHRTLGKQLLALAGENGAAMLSQIDGEIITELRMQWMERGISSATHRNYLAVLANFFSYAVRENLLSKSPLPPKKDWPPAKGIERDVTLPLDVDGTAANYHKVVAAIEAGADYMHGNGIEPILRGTRLALLARLMYTSGLRISDAILFQPGKLILDDEIATYTFLPEKTKRYRKTCTTFLGLDLARAITALPALSPGYPFYQGKDRVGHCQSARREIVRCGETVGVRNARPHRFRDSFAINQLNSGTTSMDELSKLLGHASVTITERYYAPWVQSRHDHLRRTFLKSQPPAPAPPSNVVPISKLG